MDKKPAFFIVCEPTARWFAALQAVRASTLGKPFAVRLRRAPSLEYCDRLLEEAPRSAVALETRRESLGDVLRWLAQRQRCFPEVRVAVLSSAELSQARSAFREAGASLVIDSQVQAAQLLEFASRHLGEVPAGEAEYVSQLKTALPWGRFGSEPF